MVFRRQATTIDPSHKATLRPFFGADLLDDVNIVESPVPEPAFYHKLEKLGIANAPRFSEMAGITFQDVVVHAEALTLPLLFHELVHAVQYKHLGVLDFAEHYVRGFLSGGSYEEIPLEKQAYELEGRFSSHTGPPFSVDEDVHRRLKLGQL